MAVCAALEAFASKRGDWSLSRVFLSPRTAALWRASKHDFNPPQPRNLAFFSPPLQLL